MVLTILELLSEAQHRQRPLLLQGFKFPQCHSTAFARCTYSASRLVGIVFQGIRKVEIVDGNVFSENLAIHDLADSCPAKRGESIFPRFLLDVQQKLNYT